MKKILAPFATLATTAALAGAVVIPAGALAQSAAPAPATAAPASPHTFTGNLALVSDYRFRGISQTYRGPAVQGGFDYAHESGFYVGNWNSSVSSLVYLGGSGIEMDVYGGWKKTWGDWGLDIGLLTYQYPNAELNARTTPASANAKAFNNNEVYLGGSWKWASLKYSRASSDYFGLGSEQVLAGYWTHRTTSALLPNRGGSSGTGYLDLTLAVPVNEKLTVNVHAGRVKVRNYDELSYNDYKLGITYDAGGWLLGANYVGTNARKEWYYTAGSKGNKDIGNGALVLSVGKTF